MATAELTETGFDPENLPLEPLTVVEQRAVEIANLLSRGYSQPNIVHALVQKHKVHRSEIYKALPRAKEILRESTEHDLVDLIAIQVGRYEHIMSARDEVVLTRDEKTGEVIDRHVIEGPSHRDKIAAIDSLCRLLGLNQPTKVALTQADGSSVSLLSIIMNVEAKRRAPVIDVASIDTTMLALPKPSGGENEDID